jgi:hypothetical protein
MPPATAPATMECHRAALRFDDERSKLRRLRDMGTFAGKRSGNALRRNRYIATKLPGMVTRVSNPPIGKRENHKPSIVPKRKESFPNNACFTSEMRVLLRLIPSIRGIGSQCTNAEDEPRNIPDTCQEQDKIDPGANGKSESSGT